MKASSWEECIEASVSVRVTPNKAKAKSLYETALGRIGFLEESQLKEENANYIFENYYSSALEILHAILLVDGFKADNHLCTGYYLRDVLKVGDLFRVFDDCRFKRNSLVYYGKKADFSAAKENIREIKLLIKELVLMYKNKLKP
ncbi:hypothetical protein HY638_01980 [Candidatus Woesearchaeota archaeon]|nr:hypothetical protein [Candidatus Woesearchaeota archaeon]